MIDSLYIGASGLNGFQQGVDIVSNNLANMNTVAFKKARADFQDLYSREVGKASSASQGRLNVTQPTGVSVASVSRIFTEGEYQPTQSPLDLAIQGSGFFEIVMPDGSSAYTRNGSFHLNADRMMVTTEGYVLRQEITVPEGATDVAIDATGTVRVTLDGNQSQEEIGQIELANFVNPSALKPLGGGLYEPTDSSGEVQIGKAGEQGLGRIAQGILEASNIKLVDELVALMVAQRGYEASSKIVQASDEILSIVNNLRR